MKTLLEERLDEHLRISNKLSAATIKQRHFLNLSLRWEEDVNEAKFALAFIDQQIEELNAEAIA